MPNEQPRMPRTVEEYRRVAHVFFGGALHPGQDYHIMASAEPPHRVYAVFPAAGARPQVEPVDGDEVIVLGPIRAPQPPFATGDRHADEVHPICHDPETTEPTCDDENGRDDDDDEDEDKKEDKTSRIRMSEVRKLELRVEWKRGDRTFWRRWRLRRFDALFLTRGAMEMFFYPHYEAAFGRRYTQALRKRMGHDQ